MRAAAALIGIGGTAFLVLAAFKVIPLPSGALWAVTVAPASWMLSLVLFLAALRRERRAGERPPMEHSPSATNLRERMLPGAAIVMAVVIGSIAVMFVAIDPASVSGWLSLGFALAMGFGSFAARHYFRSERLWAEKRADPSPE